MKTISVELKTSSNLQIGDLFKYANGEAKGYGLKVGDDEVTLLSGQSAFYPVDPIRVFGGRPILKIKNAFFFEPDLSDKCIDCPGFPQPGDLVAINGALLLCLSAKEGVYFNLDSLRLMPASYRVSPDECIVVKEWTLKVDVQTETKKLVSRK